MFGNARASLTESGFTGFRFAQFALFATTGNLAKMNTDERSPTKDELAES